MAPARAAKDDESAGAYFQLGASKAGPLTSLGSTPCPLFSSSSTVDVFVPFEPVPESEDYF